jgi:nucleoid DNA-binding protein
MEKPMSMPLKDFLIRKLSQKLNIPERVIDVVITDQFTSAFKATTTCNSIELSGFGKLMFLPKKAAKQMVKYEEQKNIFETALLVPNLTEEAARVINLKLATVQKNIDHLKPKLR